jgi:hypothetical protein
MNNLLLLYRFACMKNGVLADIGVINDITPVQKKSHMKKDTLLFNLLQRWIPEKTSSFASGNDFRWIKTKLTPAEILTSALLFC